MNGFVIFRRDPINQYCPSASISMLRNSSSLMRYSHTYSGLSWVGLAGLLERGSVLCGPVSHARQMFRTSSSIGVQYELWWLYHSERSWGETILFCHVLQWQLMRCLHGSFIHVRVYLFVAMFVFVIAIYYFPNDPIKLL